MVDTIFADVAQPDQARIVAINAHHFLRNEGHVVISIKVFHALLNTVYVLFYFAMRTGFSSDSGLWPVPMDRDWHWSGTHNLALPWTECWLQSLQLHCTGSQVAQMARPHACVAQPFTCSLPHHCQYWIGTKPLIWRWLLLLDRLKFSFDWIVLTLLTNVSGKFGNVRKVNKSQSCLWLHQCNTYWSALSWTASVTYSFGYYFTY